MKEDMKPNITIAVDEETRAELERQSQGERARDARRAAHELRSSLFKTPLTSLMSIPYRVELVEHGYGVLEDLIGSDADELVAVAELTPSAVNEVLTALQCLLP